MPSRAPTYYHWSQDKPCTTNQVYGFMLKDSMVQVKSDRKPGPLDYTRPFSNSGFFPQISQQSALTGTCKADRRALRSANDAGAARLKQSSSKFDLNRGYVMGHTPVTEKVVKASLPNGLILNRGSSAPAKVPEYKKAKGDNTYLWHTLSGNLVHVKNYHGQEAQEVF